MKALKITRLIFQALFVSWLLSIAMIGAQKSLYNGMMAFAACGVVLAIITAIEAARLASQSKSTK